MDSPITSQILHAIGIGLHDPHPASKLHQWPRFPKLITPLSLYALKILDIIKYFQESHHIIQSFIPCE